MPLGETARNDYFADEPLFFEFRHIENILNRLFFCSVDEPAGVDYYRLYTVINVTD